MSMIVIIVNILFDIQVTGGPVVQVRLSAVVTVPTVTVSTDTLQFDTIQCGMCQVIVWFYCPFYYT